MSLRSALPFLLAAAPALHAQTTPAPAKRPMTPLDAQQMRNVGGPAPSPDGKWVLYTVSFPDWKEARRQTDIFLVSAEQGVASTKQLTFTKDKNETSPTWSRDGAFFVFASNRDAPSAGGAAPNAGAPNAGGGGGTQLYVMRPDGGEARKITEARDGVSTFEFTRDGRSLIYRSGKAGEEQLYRLPVAGIDSAKPEQLTRHATGVGLWRLAPDDRRIYFITADTIDQDEKLRRDRRFTVTVRNMETPVSSLWAFDMDGKRTTRLTRDTAMTVSTFTVSDDGK